ncbi:tetraacyldisaccharide 4'-kinase [Flavobacterium sp.]|uniref:tetraacyldisaccharide 4'-kinase n=1 Tax=Flavobacterium sp. TaxID=239 RepID=UPI0039E6B794
MNLLRKILFPLAVLYGWVTQLRNFLFDRKILKSYSFDLPVIAVGNLSVGGTGKSPMIEYLIRLLAEKYKIATLSRGYKRTTQGFVLADSNASAESIGDEPFQFYNKFPQILVAVDANRKNGIENLLGQNPPPQIILLDDAFQHRKVKAGCYILLTAYGDLYADDWMLPTGNLRESRSGSKRADVIIVTKCPPDLSRQEQNKIWEKLNIGHNQLLYFTCIQYDDRIYTEHESLSVNEIKSSDKLLLAGIAKPKPFFAYLQGENDTIMEFPDHHHFSETDIQAILSKANGRKIITTEKDYVRLNGKIPADQLFYLPIRSQFLDDATSFDCRILDFVAEQA